MTRNLLSVGKLTDSGLLASFEVEWRLVVTKDTEPLVVASGFRNNNSKLYYLLLTDAPSINTTDILLTQLIDRPGEVMAYMSRTPIRVQEPLSNVS